MNSPEMNLWGGLKGWHRNQMTQGIPGVRHFPLVSRPQFPQQRSLEGLWPCSCRLLCYLLHLPSPPRPSPASAFSLQETLTGLTGLHWARRIQVCIDRGLVSHTSSSRQASSPSQMAEKHPTQVGRTGVRPGDTLSLSLAPAALASLKGCFLGAGGWVTGGT